METNKRILGINIRARTKNAILETIKIHIDNPRDFYHIVSLNPENLVIAQNNEEFKKVIETAQMVIIDGVGVVIAGQILGVPIGDRVTGVDLMHSLVNVANEKCLSVMLIGAKGNLADRLVNCYKTEFKQAKFVACEGFKDIVQPTKDEEERIFSIVASVRPRLIFVAFGSPFQEIWLWRNRERLQGSICMGVGGAFDYFAGNARRPPVLVRKIGLEWLFRLLHQPWRWKRQLRLLVFLKLVLKERLGLNHYQLPSEKK